MDSDPFDPTPAGIECHRAPPLHRAAPLAPVAIANLYRHLYSGSLQCSPSMLIIRMAQSSCDDVNERSLSDSGEDCKDQFRYSISRDITTQIDRVE